MEQWCQRKSKKRGLIVYTCSRASRRIPSTYSKLRSTGCRYLCWSPRLTDGCCIPRFVTRLHSLLQYSRDDIDKLREASVPVLL